MTYSRSALAQAEFGFGRQVGMKNHVHAIQVLVQNHIHAIQVPVQNHVHAYSPRTLTKPQIQPQTNPNYHYFPSSYDINGVNNYKTYGYHYHNDNNESYYGQILNNLLSNIIGNRITSPAPLPTPVSVSYTHLTLPTTPYV